ncbi:D-methionine transport system permease protein [Orenia metallireducens]|jgi:D-methionine transport system permease protein|uniref:D-methionine transport system permease protein n=1 Tax=Orenia metallireducens TaxID=1413210 RepID=A0A285GF73_9FIRM|nr:methionine ABC transporter permease [Orenia metallireducens]PRX32517.1 D-methionine transport system permease protein [Orenia metallireducens]SNY21011.1 D-methionine transport system permease protein [Orenia metallireducens]
MKEVFSLLIKDSGLLWQGILQTAYMVSVSMLLASLFGIPLGIGVVVSEEGNILENKAINLILSTFINITRSIPFIILMVALIPLTRIIVGTSIGTSAAVVSLTIGAVPFIGRIVEGALKEVDGGVIEAAQAMGANPWEIISKVLLPEALPSLVLGLTITAISLIGYSAIAGAIGAGGLGDIAIRYGYHRFQTDVMIKTVVLLVVIVQIIQNLGTYLARRLDHS